MSYVTRKPRPAKETRGYSKPFDGYEIDDWWETGGPDQITIHEDDAVRRTGLVDIHGNELCWVPMGFRAK